MSWVKDKFDAAKDELTSSHQAYQADRDWFQAEASGNSAAATEAQTRFNQAVENVEDAKNRLWGQ